MAVTLATEKKKHKLLRKELKIKPLELDLDLDFEDDAGSLDSSNLLSERNDHDTSLMLPPIKSGKERSTEYKHIDAVEKRHSFATSKHASIVQSTDMLHSSSEDEAPRLGSQQPEELEELEEQVLIDRRRERRKSTDMALGTEKSPNNVDPNKKATMSKPTARSIKTKNDVVVRQDEQPMSDYAALASLSTRIAGNSSSPSSSSESDSKPSKRSKYTTPPSPIPTNLTSEPIKKGKQINKSKSAMRGTTEGNAEMDKGIEDVQGAHKRWTDPAEDAVTDTLEQEQVKRAAGRPAGSSNKRTMKRAVAKKAAEQRLAGDDSKQRSTKGDSHGDQETKKK